MRIMGSLVLPSASCTLTVSLGGVTVDTLCITYSNIASLTSAYNPGRVSVSPKDANAVLQFGFTCNAFTTTAVDLLLGQTEMTGGGFCGGRP